MVDSTPQKSVLVRAERLVASRLDDMRRLFEDTASGAASEYFDKGAHGGNTHRQHLHDICAAELHGRAELLTASVIQSHRAMSAPPTKVHRDAAKDWIAARVAAESRELQHCLWKPNVEVTARSQLENLGAESRREIESAYAIIDTAFDVLERDRVERAVRWITRVVQRLEHYAGWSGR